MEFGLRPVRCFEIENYHVGEVLAMFVLAAENKELAALP
jgi:hypothetical protein